jgi:hypothetical protein
MKIAKNAKFEIQKRFTSGILKGMVIEDTSPIPLKVGKVYKGLRGSGNYLVENCKRIY